MAGTPQQPIKVQLSCHRDCCHLFNPELLAGSVCDRSRLQALRGQRPFMLGPIGVSGLSGDLSSLDSTAARMLAMMNL